MRWASPSALSTSITSPWLAASAVSVAMPASGSPAARWVLARRIWAVTNQGEVAGTSASASVASANWPSASRISAARSCASIRSGRMCSATRACTSATRCDSSVLSASASVRKVSAAPSAALVIWSNGTSSPAARRRAQVEERRVGHAAGQRVVDQLDRIRLAVELREDLGVGDDRRPVEVQRSLVAAGEDGLGGDEVAGERQRQRLVVLAVGDQRVVAGHRVELRLGGGEIVAPDLDPAGEQPAQERVQRRLGRLEHRRRLREVARGDRVADPHQRRHLVARVGRLEPVGQRPGGGDVAHRHAADHGVGQQPDVGRVERQRLVVVGRGLDIVVPEVGLHRGEVGPRQARRGGRQRHGREERGQGGAARQGGEVAQHVAGLPGCDRGADPMLAGPADSIGRIAPAGRLPVTCSDSSARRRPAASPRRCSGSDP